MRDEEIMQSCDMLHGVQNARRGGAGGRQGGHSALGSGPHSHDELLDVGEDDAPLLHRLDNGAEVVVDQDQLRSALSNLHSQSGDSNRIR